MTVWTTLSLYALGLAVLLLFGALGITSHLEGERRATRTAFTLAAGGLIVFLVLASLPLTIRLVGFWIVSAVVVLSFVLFLLPIGRIEPGNDIPTKRFDERDVMFARARLEPGSPEHISYYEMRPENKESDNRFRSRPGLLSLDSRFGNPFLFASPEASFALTEALRYAVEGPVSRERHELPVGEMTAYMRGLAYYFGALDVGITELKPYHVYSHVGRGTGAYGAPIPITHSHAIAFTVEMDFFMIGPNPAPTGTMESARQYVEAARVAVQLASAIRFLGYSARAHIDGNYHVIAPLVARDAGLGEIGRIGLLMTPSHGPRVRLGVVTTDLELVPDQRVRDPAVIDFCNICMKCAENCPPRAIPTGGREEVDGCLRWRINPDKCFRYWCTVGTDCGRCMTVCPYSHPNNIVHNVVRWGNARSGAFRRFALWMDDVFYGKEPAARSAPEWTQVP